MAKAMVIYHSDRGHTRRIAEWVAEGVRENGAEAEPVAAESVDLSDAAVADGFAIGSPDYFSYVAGPVKWFFDRILYDKSFEGKPFVGFGTHGGGAKVLGVVETLADYCKLKRVRPGLLVKTAEVDAAADDARALGKALAEALPA
jgi:multimeric flavodoxin WrbA